MRKPPDHYQSPDPQQARFNRATVDAAEFVLKRAGVDYDIVSVDLDVTPAPVRHRLGRDWSGWLVVDQTGGAVVWRSTTSTASSLILQASAPAPSTKIMVF